MRYSREKVEGMVRYAKNLCHKFSYVRKEEILDRNNRIVLEIQKKYGLTEMEARFIFEHNDGINAVIQYLNGEANEW